MDSISRPDHKISPKLASLAVGHPHHPTALAESGTLASHFAAAPVEGPGKISFPLIDGLVVWRFGGLVVWWFAGGLEVRRCGGWVVSHLTSTRGGSNSLIQTIN